VLSGEATNTNLIVFDLIGPALDPKIYHTRDEHASYYTTALNLLINKISIGVKPCVIRLALV